MKNKKNVFILMIICVVVIVMSCCCVNVNSSKVETYLLYKIGDNSITQEIPKHELTSYVNDSYEWSIEPTILMYSPDGDSSWIWNSEVDMYKEQGWTLTPQAVFTYDVFQKSNLTVDQLNMALSGTGLTGYGQAFYDMEQTYGVNSLFAIAVGSHESANFYKKANTHNYFGFRGNRGWMSFSSPEACINYFGQLMNNRLYYGKSIEQIAVIYCNSSWSGYVKAHMYEKWQKVGV